MLNKKYTELYNKMLILEADSDATPKIYTLEELHDEKSWGDFEVIFCRLLASCTKKETAEIALDIYLSVLNDFKL